MDAILWFSCRVWSIFFFFQLCSYKWPTSFPWNLCYTAGKKLLRSFLYSLNSYPLGTLWKWPCRLFQSNIWQKTIFSFFVSETISQRYTSHCCNQQIQCQTSYWQDMERLVDFSTLDSQYVAVSSYFTCTGSFFWFLCFIL